MYDQCCKNLKASYFRVVSHNFFCFLWSKSHNPKVFIGKMLYHQIRREPHLHTKKCLYRIKMRKIKYQSHQERTITTMKEDCTRLRDFIPACYSTIPSPSIAKNKSKFSIERLASFLSPFDSYTTLYLPTPTHIAPTLTALTQLTPPYPTLITPLPNPYIP